MGGGESLFIMFGNRGNDDDACVGLPAFYKIRLWGEQWLMGNVVLCMRTTVWQGVEVCVTMVTQCVCAKAGGAVITVGGQRSDYLFVYQVTD